MTWARRALSSCRLSGSKNRRRSTSATSSLRTGCTPSSRCRRKTSNRSACNRWPVSSRCFCGSVASSEATIAARSTFATACVRHWKKSTIRSRQIGFAPAFWRAYISTSSTRSRVDRPRGGAFEQRGQQRLGRRRLPLLGCARPVEGAQAVGAAELEGEHAPGMAQRADFAVRSAHAVDAPLDVDLVEAERDGDRPRQRAAGPELPHRGQVGQRVRVPEQVVQRDQRVRLAAAVGRAAAPPCRCVRPVARRHPAPARGAEESGKVSAKNRAGSS